MGLLLKTIDGYLREHIIYDAVISSWSLTYGEGGSGFGYLKFSVPGAIMARPELGLGYDVKLYKNTMLLFCGQIRQKTQNTQGNVSKIDVTVYGYLNVLDDRELTKFLCETKLSSWKVRDEVAVGDFRPDCFGTGTNPLGLFIHVANNNELLSGQYTALDFAFDNGESIVSLDFDISSVFGTGLLYTSTIYRLTGNKIYLNTPFSVDYNFDGLYIYNSDLGKSALMTGKGFDTRPFVTVQETGSITGWLANHKVYIFGPKFIAKINNIIDNKIYFMEETGIGNLQFCDLFFNVTKKSSFLPSGYDVSQKYIVVDNDDDLAGYQRGDIIVAPAYLYSAKIAQIVNISGKHGVHVIFESGRDFVSSNVGWTLCNITRKKCATVSEWYESINKYIFVTSQNDLVGWSEDDTVAIGAPFRVKIVDGLGQLLWPTDLRFGSFFYVKEHVSVDLSSIKPGSLSIVFECYIPGSGSEFICVMLDKIKVYSVTPPVTASSLARAIVREYSPTILEEDYSRIYNSDRVLEPLIFENQRVSEAMKYVCQLGNMDNVPLAWGLGFEERRRLFLEPQNRQDIRYYIKPEFSSFSLGRDVTSSFQMARAEYNNKLNLISKTSWRSRPEDYFNYNYRSTTVKVDNADTEQEAIDAIDVLLNDVSKGKISISVNVNAGGILDSNMHPVPIEEVRPGGMIEILDWFMTGNDSRNFIRMLTGVEVNWSEQTLTLIMEEQRDEFQSYMENMSRVVRR